MDSPCWQLVGSTYPSLTSATCWRGRETGIYETTKTDNTRLYNWPIGGLTCAYAGSSPAKNVFKFPIFVPLKNIMMFTNFDNSRTTSRRTSDLCFAFLPEFGSCHLKQSSGDGVLIRETLVSRVDHRLHL